MFSADDSSTDLRFHPYPSPSWINAINDIRRVISAMLLITLGLSTKIKKTEQLAGSSCIWWLAICSPLQSFFRTKGRTSRRRYKVTNKNGGEDEEMSITTTILRIASSRGLSGHRKHNSFS